MSQLCTASDSCFKLSDTKSPTQGIFWPSPDLKDINKYDQVWKYSLLDKRDPGKS